MKQEKKEIIKIIQEMEGSYSAHEIFSDWVRCAALATSNACQIRQNAVWQAREEEYIRTMKKYPLEQRKRFAEITVLLIFALEEMRDVLGKVYMELGGSKSMGQFFTPFHISELCAEVSLEHWKQGEIYKLNEPTCGSGGMIIATASGLRKKGINYQKVMEVIAQDLDWRGVYMCYLQLSYLGIKATVVQGNTLAEPYSDKTEESHILITPAKRGMLL